MYIYIHIYIYTYINLHIYTCVHIYVMYLYSSSLHTHIYKLNCTPFCEYPCIYINSYAIQYADNLVYIHTCIHVRTYASNIGFS